MEFGALQEVATSARWVLLVGLLIITSWTDTRTERIRNVHTFPAMALGLILGFLSGGVDGLLVAALGIGLAFLAMFPLFAMGIMKAGDAKMLMAIGALAGPGIALRALIASFIVFLPVAVVVLFLKGKLGNAGQALYRIWRFLYTTVHPVLDKEPLATEGGVWTPYALVLGVGTLLVWQTPFLDLKLGIF